MRPNLYQLLMAFAFLTLVFCKPIEKLVKPLGTEGEAAAPGAEPGDESLPNLRKVLYPTYAREPYGSDFYTNIDMGNPSYGSWGPMYRYNDLFDRSMRSQLKAVQLAPLMAKPPQLGGYSSFGDFQNPPFVPFTVELEKVADSALSSFIINSSP